MKKEYKIGLVIIILVGFYFGYLAFKVGPVSVGSALDGGASTSVGTSTDFAVVGNTVYSLIGTSTCTGRTITTGPAVSLQFGDEQGDRLTGFVGHWQAASTTITYGSENQGCGKIRIRSEATGIIRITDFR